MLGDSVRRRHAPRRPPRPPTDGRRILPRWSRGRWAALLAAAVVLPFVLGYAVAVLVLFPAPPTAAGGIATPDLVGATEREANERLVAAGLGTASFTRLPHPTAQTGRVIAQSPLPGQQLRNGAGVRAAVSTGVPRATVPDVVGFSEGRAAALLRRFGFTVSREIEASEEEVGHVTRTDPSSGRELALPARITIHVSDGSLRLPDLPDTTDVRWPQTP